MRQRLALILAGSLLGALLLELALRLWWPQPLYATRASYLGWAHVPNACFTYSRPEFRTRIRYNRAGLRDREHALAKPPQTVRILCLGDSFTEGMEVSQDVMWTRRLEQLLNARLGGRPVVEVINAGVPGYGLDQMTLYLRREGWQYQPDVVVVLHMGFFEREAAHRLARLTHGQLELREAVFTPGQLAVRRVVGWLRYHSHLVAGLCDATKGLPGFEQLYAYLKCWRSDVPVETLPLADASSRITPSTNLALTCALLRYLQAITAARHARLLIALGDERAMTLMPCCRAARVECYPLADRLAAWTRAGRSTTALRYARDGHWNSEGHRVVAEQLASWLLRDASAPSAPSPAK